MWRVGVLWFNKNAPTRVHKSATPTTSVNPLLHKDRMQPADEVKMCGFIVTQTITSGKWPYSM
jgi:hypothetical protein